MIEYLEELETGWGLQVVPWFRWWRAPLNFDAALTLSLTGEVLGFVPIWVSYGLPRVFVETGPAETGE